MISHKYNSRLVLISSLIALAFGAVNGFIYLVFRDGSQALNLGRVFAYGAHVTIGVLCFVLADCVIKIERRLDKLEEKSGE
jgi:hypothetical protein